MTLIATPAARIAAAEAEEAAFLAAQGIDINGVCLDCEDAPDGVCGECAAPVERWEYTTPRSVWEV